MVIRHDFTKSTDEYLDELISLPHKIKVSLRHKIYERIELMGSATCYEIVRDLGIKHQTASTRITELIKMKIIFDCGERRLNDTNRRVRVYRICQYHDWADYETDLQRRYAEIIK